MPRAALFQAVGAPVVVADVDVGAPGPGQVRVAIAAAGVCHSDLSVVDGVLDYGPGPLVLGHEGAGVVTDVGTGVEHLAPGDHVVLSCVAQCGTCYFCTHHAAHLCQSGTAPTSRVAIDGTPIAQMLGLGTFATDTVVAATAAVPVPDDLPLTEAALLGCAVLTGVGAALNTATIASGDTVAVVGCGGVGLNTIQGARLAGARTIVAIDRVGAKLDLARTFGATDVVDANADDAVRVVRELTGGRGADVAFEVVGSQATTRDVIRMTRPGGEAVFVGVGPPDVTLSVPVGNVVGSGKTLKGCMYGSADVRRDVPRLVEHHRAGDLLLDELISDRIGLDQVNDALTWLERGEVTRSVVEL